MYFTARRAISHTEGIRFIEKRTLQNAKSFFLSLVTEITGVLNNRTCFISDYNIEPVCQKALYIVHLFSLTHHVFRILLTLLF